MLPLFVLPLELSPRFFSAATPADPRAEKTVVKTFDIFKRQERDLKCFGHVSDRFRIFWCWAVADFRGGGML